MSARPGLYVHLPFCARRCAYCTFSISTDRSAEDRYLASLREEIRLVAPEASSAAFDSVYLGGGTPSLLPAERAAGLLERLRGAFSIAGDAEITLEANPEDVEPGRADAWRRAGVTRVSLGVQSFSDVALRAAGRTHSASQARRAFSLLREAGFETSCDLILGLRGETGESFLAGVREIIEGAARHVSLYILEGARAASAFGPDEEADLYLAAGETLAAGGLERYEVSNWARPGARSRHNRKYWERVPTLGLGVSAHELWNGRRRANTASLGSYLAGLSEGRRPTVRDEWIDEEEAVRETILLSARTSEGVPAALLDRWIASSGDEHLRSDWRAWLDAGLMRLESGHYRFTSRGFLLSNEVLCRFAA